VVELDERFQPGRVDESHLVTIDEYPCLEALEHHLGARFQVAHRGHVDLAANRDARQGCAMAGVTLVRDGVPMTPIFTDPAASEIDRARYDAGTGPCLDAYRDGTILRIDDTEDDDRWPEFASAAKAHGIRSTLSLPLRAEDASIGALNLYSYRSNAFADDEQMAMVFVSHAAAVLATSQAYYAAQTLSSQLQNALVPRAVIEQANGIISAIKDATPMRRSRC
jgi:GAF domain-containing protein